jgi:signal transduction histidine kinase
VHYQLELETKVEERTNELKKALQAEKELVEMKSNFISVASHEFRTPLSTIYLAAGFIKRFKDKITPEQLISKLMAIDKQVAIMTYLLDDVLFVGKAESGKIEFQLDLVPLDILKSIAFEAMSSKPSGHKLEIESDYSITHVQTDERLLRNIIINLITNAIKFSPQSETIVMKIKCDEENLVISVIDTGIGISEEDQAKLFTSFFRGKNADTIEGTGLGLTILKKATEIMKGNVLINSKLGSGTEITVSLPLRF